MLPTKQSAEGILCVQQSITCYTLFEMIERRTVMANMKKFADMRDIGHLCAHYERSVQPGHYSNKDIDQARLAEDRVNLAPARKGGQTTYIKQQISAVMGDRTLRKDAVKMCCWVVSVPENLSKDKEQEFFRATYDFLVDRYGNKSGMGENCVISAYIHRSETTPHLHFAFLPVLERDGKRTFCAKQVVGRSDLATFHKDFAAYMTARGICSERDILTGNTQRDSRGRALSVEELKRSSPRERDRWTRSRTNDRERGRDKWS